MTRVTGKVTSIEPIALHLGVPMRLLQHFIAQSPWSIEPINDQHQRLVGATLGENDGVFLVAESGVVKQGQDSVGVDHQYCGSVGKVANAQSNTPCRVDALAQRLPKSAWKRTTINEGSKGPLGYDVVVIRGQQRETDCQNLTRG